jgi:hypothetical protein
MGRSNSKTLVEECLALDVRYLSRKGYLEPWQRWFLELRNGYYIAIVTEAEAIILSYILNPNGPPPEQVPTRVYLSWTSCNYGGMRPWFICPGRGCGRRIAKLYFNSKYFLCRHCHNLAYYSQSQAEESRLLDKAQKIYKRLGVDNCNDLYSTPKPKGMHKITYRRLIRKAQKLEHESLYALNMKYHLV